jgi:hypothetical protein
VKQIWKPLWPRRVVITLLAIHATLLGLIAAVNSPNIDELAHLPSGLSHWRLGGFELYRVNPPLVRMAAAIPVLLTGAKTGWSTSDIASADARPEFTLGKQFVKANGRACFWYFTLARWALIPLCLVGGCVSYRWASDLYGWQSGLIAVALYSFCPNLLAWGASITPDAVATSLGLLAGYAFWRWLKQPGWLPAAWAGVALGLAELTKTTWVLLFVLWPSLWLVWRVSNRTPRVSQLLAILLIGIYCVNLGYVFEGSFKPINEYRFVSQALTGRLRTDGGDNRFADSWIGSLPVPFPENYIRGIDVQKFDFEAKKTSYLRGEQRKGGWWYYYVYCGMVKTPVGTLALIAAASIAAVLDRRSGGTWLDLLVLLSPAIAVFGLVSSQTGFNRYYRYVLPALPFLYIAVSRVGLVLANQRPLLSAVVGIFLASSVVESLAVVPHSLSFFNLLAGGPRGGHFHLVDANIDWGQDLLFLKKWYDEHIDARPLPLAYFGGLDIDPQVAGIDWRPLPRIPATGDLEGTRVGGQVELDSGWHALSVNYLKGYRHSEQDEPVYTYFQKLQPAATAGYSIYVYHVTLEQAARINRESAAPRRNDPPELKTD